MAHKILVVDEEENMLRLFKRVLGRQGYEVFCAESGLSGLELLARNKMDLAIVDLDVPDMDGMVLIRKLNDLQPHLPVIAVTAQPTREREQAACKSGCESFLSKPLNLKKLSEMVRSFSVD